MCNAVLLHVWTSAALPLLAVPQAIAVDIGRYVEHQTNKAAIFSAVGAGLCEVGHVSRGVECLERSRAIYVVLGDERAERRVLLQMGETYLQVGRFTLAICCFQEALALSQRLGRVAEVEALRLLAIGYEQAAMPFSAADVTQQAALLDGSGVVDVPVH